MMTMSSRLAAGLFAATLLTVAVNGRAQSANAAQKPATTMNSSTKEVLSPDSTTEGSVDAGGQHIDYTAVAGTITVGATDAQDEQLGPDGKPQPGSQLAINAPASEKDAPPVARMFYVAYFKKGARAEDRPITFMYNGGPGGASVWLHMGSLGPKHVETEGDTHLPAAPYKLVDNPYTLLDVSDVVFIDMPGTGFGRLIGKDPEKAFWGLDEDADAFARFIARFNSKYGRWNSPKFIFGESYGTTRSALLADRLENDQSIDLNGVILLSQIFVHSISIDATRANPGVDLAYELALPTYAATAWYHKKLPTQPAELEPFLKEVEAYATGPYVHALAQGNNISADEKQQVAEKLHEYTGLPVSYLLMADLRVSGLEFEKTLLGDTDMTTGRLDTRFSGPSLDSLSEGAEYDPEFAAIGSAYVALFNDYVRKTLKYGEGQTYTLFAHFNDISAWDMKRGGRPADMNILPDLADAMKKNPRLKVMVNGGYFDLATPFFAAQYEDAHLPIPQSLAGNITYAWYQSGHMLYVHDDTLKQLHDRVAAFIKSADAATQ